MWWCLQLERQRTSCIGFERFGPYEAEEVQARQCLNAEVAVSPSEWLCRHSVGSSDPPVNVSPMHPLMRPCPRQLQEALAGGFHWLVHIDSDEVRMACGLWHGAGVHPPPKSPLLHANLWVGEPTGHGLQHP